MSIAFARPWRALVVGALAGLAALVLGGPAGAAAPEKTIVKTTVVVRSAVARTCTAAPLAAGRGVASRGLTATADGAVRARLNAAAGDWDVAVFDAKTRRLVAGSTQFGAREVAASYVTKGQRLTVQACRLSGGAATAKLDVTVEAFPAAKAEKVQLVRVIVPSRSAVRKLEAAGLDLTEHGGQNFVEVVLYGAEDAAKVLRAGFPYSVVVPDMAKQSIRQRRAEREFAARVATSALPSGRTTYRRLPDYTNEMKALAYQHPHLVTPIILPFQTYEGRPVEGIEITTNPTNLRDGKPIFLQMGAHHAREWPSAEHAMEWAYELIRGYNNGDPRTVNLVSKTRTIVIPVVNADGFNMSREAGEALGAGGGRGGSEGANIQNFANEYRRKNCRVPNGPAAGNCALVPTAAGLAEGGVDPNRNYGGFWGGPGASEDPTNLIYRGPAPFSEPETQNIRALVSTRQVTTLITNHTFSNLVLRPPGLAAQGLSPDEPTYKALGDRMASKNGYSSQFGWQLYDTTGTTEDWTYYATGGFGFTFEIGPKNFHPPFQDVIAEYFGTTQAAANRGGNREAYFIAQENTADNQMHSRIAGNAPAGAILKISKTFETPTSLRNNDAQRSWVTFSDTLTSSMLVPANGSFVWHVNPSTRPYAAQSRGRVATGVPSPAQTFSGLPAPGAVPCAEFETEDPTCYDDYAFTVSASGNGIDNEYTVIRLEWTTPGSDYDMKIYRDVNEDGQSAGDPKVGQSGNGTTNFEQTTLVRPEPGKYVVRVINWAGAEPFEGAITFYGPDPPEPARTETYTFTCENPAGTLQWAKQVKVDRGQRLGLDLRSACKKR